MCGPMEGELIARAGARSNVRNGLVRKPYEGCFVRRLRFGATAGQGQTRTDRHSGAPVDATIRRRACEARERRSGKTPVKVFVSAPWKGKTQGRIQRLAA